MILHADDQDGTPSLVDPTKAILARSMDFGNDLFILADLIGLEALIPLDPLDPHFNELVLLELTGDAEASDSVYVGIEVLAVLEMLEFIIENVDDDLLLGLDLGQFAVGDTEGVFLIHLININNTKTTGNKLLKL